MRIHYFGKDSEVIGTPGNPQAEEILGQEGIFLFRGR